MVANGESFGAAGPAERLTGTAFFEVDPADKHNAVVFDLDKAPRNARGQVEFSADMMILKPIDLAKSSRTLFFEVNNRGRKITFQRMQDAASDANMNAPLAPHDFGNGFLLKRGYILAWVGWGADVAPGDNRMTVRFPIAQENGQPITERILTEFGDRNFNGALVNTLPLSGGTGFNSFPAVSTNKSAAQAELWVAQATRRVRVRLLFNRQGSQTMSGLSPPVRTAGRVRRARPTSASSTRSKTHPTTISSIAQPLRR